MDIKQLFTIFKRWLWLVVLGVIIGGSLGYYFSSRQTPVYQASTRFLVLRSAQTTYDYYSYLDSQNQISTYAQLLTTEDLLYQASQELGFPVIKGQASASQVGETNFVQLTVKDTDPFKAAAIANGLVKVLIDQNEQLQSIRYDNAEINLQARISEAQDQIDVLESQIVKLSSETVQSQIGVVQAKMDEVQTEINEYKNLISQIDPLNASEEDQANLVAYQAKIDELSPILSLYQNIYTELVVLGRTAEGTAPTPSELNQLNTTLALYQQIYISSISSLENLRLAKAQNSPIVKQVETAVKPSVPISPKPVQTGMIGATIGLLITAAVAFLIEYLDDTLKTPDDIKNILNLPVIGFIGELRNSNKSTDDSLGVYVAKNPRSPVAEAFRSLRTNLEYSSIDTPLKSILVTSSGESEGKSTVAANLAIVQAQSGKKVLILDADMRRPKVHILLNKPNRMGLSDLITGKHSINEVIKHIDQIENFDIITCGTLPPNPAELLGSERMTTLLTELGELYDMIIIDSPPMIVSDALILSQKVDGMVFVVIPGQTRAIAAERPVEELNRIDSRVLGVVVNRIPKNRDYYYGGYNYYSPYTRHYEYHSGVEAEKVTEAEGKRPKTRQSSAQSKAEKAESKQ